MSVAWNALAAAPNPGLAFQQSFQQGLDRKKAEEKEWTQYLGNLAQWADTPEKWDQAVDYFAQQYPHARQFKGRFELRGALMARAGIAPPEAPGKIREYEEAKRRGLIPETMTFQEYGAGDPPQDPSIIREFDIARQRGLIPSTVTFEEFMAARNPGSQAPIVRPWNARPVDQGGQAPVRVNSPQEVEALPPGATFIAPDGSVRVKPGGSGGNVGGGFRDPLAPL